MLNFKIQEQQDKIALNQTKIKEEVLKYEKKIKSIKSDEENFK
jgi:hypothetical protein